jgi:hypothetical protein
VFFAVHAYIAIVALRPVSSGLVLFWFGILLVGLVDEVNHIDTTVAPKKCSPPPPAGAGGGGRLWDTPMAHSAASVIVAKSYGLSTHFINTRAEFTASTVNSSLKRANRVISVLHQRVVHPPTSLGF